jgi:phospholipase C
VPPVLSVAEEVILLIVALLRYLQPQKPRYLERRRLFQQVAAIVVVACVLAVTFNPVDAIVLCSGGGFSLDDLFGLLPSALGVCLAPP